MNSEIIKFCAPFIPLPEKCSRPFYISCLHTDFYTVCRWTTCKLFITTRIYFSSDTCSSVIPYTPGDKRPKFSGTGWLGPT